jgi:hypothetical protein
VSVTDSVHFHLGLVAVKKVVIIAVLIDSFKEWKLLLAGMEVTRSVVADSVERTVCWTDADHEKAKTELIPSAILHNDS